MKRRVAVLGIPMDLGAGRRGTDMGPSALRLARLGAELSRLGHEVRDLGNIDVETAEADSAAGAARNDARHSGAIELACRAAFRRFTELPPGWFPLALGGDHSIAMATVAAAFRGPAACSAVIWIDAHADLNTPGSSPSGNVHGMPLAQLLGLAQLGLEDLWGGGPLLAPEQLVYIGLRELDPFERRQIAELGISAYTMNDIDRHGMAAVFRETARRLDSFPRWHVSLDADALDPLLAPGVGTPVSGGLTYREAHLLLELLADSGRVHSADLVEVNPILDNRNRTAELMVGLAGSLLGKKIL